MKAMQSNPTTYDIDAEAIAIHVLYWMTTYQLEGRRTHLGELAADLDVRRADVRRVISALHRQGFVDALRMRVTLAGFAIGQSLTEHDLQPLRRSEAAGAGAALCAA